MADGTYDDHQLAARDFTCVTCGRRYYQTVNWGPRETCLNCAPLDIMRGSADSNYCRGCGEFDCQCSQREPRTDVSGNEMQE